MGNRNEKGAAVGLGWICEPHGRQGLRNRSGLRDPGESPQPPLWPRELENEKLH